MVPNLVLLRSYLVDRTVGFIVGTDIVTLERAWLGNKPNISCISEGVYAVLRDTTGRWQFYRVQDVKGRTDIEFHGGVIPTHSAGCILVGAYHDEKFNLKGSEQTLAEMLEAYPDGFTLTIRSFNVEIDSFEETI